MLSRRALVVGAWTWLDPALPDRPGVAPVLRQVAERLTAGGWQVRALLDDSPSDTQRPLGANLLDGLAWLRGGASTLLVVSGAVRDGSLLTRDARASRLGRTAVPLAEVREELPEGVGVVADLPVAPGVFGGSGWAVGAGAEPENSQGASPFLAAVARALAQAGGVSAAQLAVAAAAVGGWATGSLEAEVLPPLAAAPARSCAACGAEVPDASAAFCPACGASLAAGDTLDDGRYRLLRRLGEGGMGQVFLAEDTRLKVRRAIKLLALPPGLPEPEVVSMRARMIQEARATQVLADRTHHVVRVFDVGHCAERGEPFLVMELLEGETLGDRLARGPLSVDDTVSLGRTLAETLALGHARNLIHRDLKPENIMLVARDGLPFVKVLDFGLVKMEQAEVDTQSGRMMGTLQYMPPEQLKGAAVDARVDVFALGAVLYECVSGVRANPGKTPQEVFAVLLDQGVRPLAEVAPAVPADLCALVDACLSLNRDDRPADAGVVAVALGGVAPVAVESAPTWAPTPAPIASLPVSAPGASVSWPPAPAPRSGRRWLGAALVGALAAGGAVLALRPEPPPRSIGVADAGLAVDLGVDAGPVDGGLVDAALAVDAGPFAPPRVLPERATATLATSAAFVEAVGGVSAADRFARLVIEATLDGDGARWAELPAGARGWLAAQVPAADVEARGDRLRVSTARWAALRAAAPKARRVHRLGELLVAGSASPVFLRVRCAGARAGDRLFTASWSTPGYGRGRCGGAGCLRSVERALQEAERVSEALHLDLTLGRGDGGDDETTERVAARCVVPP